MLFYFSASSASGNPELAMTQGPHDLISSHLVLKLNKHLIVILSF